MNIDYKNGDATTPENKGNKIIVHICNDIGAWGKGFVMAISKRWKEPERSYRDWFKTKDNFVLGQVQFVQVEDELWVANLIGQHKINKDEQGNAPIRYEAILSGLDKSDNGLNQLGDSIEFFHINQSRKFKFDHELCELKKLKVLRLNSCGPIESLDFLSHLPNLVDFRFVNTNVLDGNLNPILEHPTIRSVGFFNKRHYNLKEDKLTLELGNKFSEEHKTFAYKGDYSTFRLDYGDNNS
eukprot:gene10113-11789_t